MHLKSILVGTDFSTFARSAADAAVDLARPFGARLLVVHVIPPTELVDYDGNLARIEHDDRGYRAAVREGVQRAGAAEVARLQAQGAEAEFVALEGRPTAELCGYAESQGCDLIVVGSHGRTGLQRFLVGSVAETVVRHAAVPVLTVRPGRKPS